MTVDISDLTIRATLVSDMAAGATKARAELASIGAETEALNAKGVKLAHESGGLGLLDARLTTVTKSATQAGSKLSEIGGDIFEKATEGAKRLAEALGLVQGGLAAIGVESAMQVSTLQTSLTTYLGNASQAATTTTAIRNMALGSMNVNVLGQANTQFLSAGMSETESLKLLGGVENIAAAQPSGQGSAVSSLSSALNQVIGSNELTGRQVRQFAPYFDVYGMMSQQLGIPRQLVRTMLSQDAPAIGTQQFLSAVENLSGPTLSRYKGALGRYAASPAGEVAQMGHNIEEQADTRIGQPLLNWIGSSVGPAANAGINTFFDKDWPGIASGMAKLGTALKADVMPGLQSIGHDIGPLVSDFGKLAPIIPPLAGALVNTGAALLNIGKDVANVVMPVAGPLLAFLLTLYNDLGPLHDVLGLLIGGFVALAVLAKVKTWVTELILPVKELTASMLGLGTAEEGVAAKSALAAGSGAGGVARAGAGMSNVLPVAAAGSAAYMGTMYALQHTPAGTAVVSAGSSVANWMGVGPEQRAQKAALNMGPATIAFLQGIARGTTTDAKLSGPAAQSLLHTAGVKAGDTYHITVDARGNPNGNDIARKTAQAVDKVAQDRRERS
jgi:hypothetical protein